MLLRKATLKKKISIWWFIIFARFLASKLTFCFCSEMSQITNVNNNYNKKLIQINRNWSHLEKKMKSFDFLTLISLLNLTVNKYSFEKEKHIYWYTKFKQRLGQSQRLLKELPAYKTSLFESFSTIIYLSLRRNICDTKKWQNSLPSFY